MSEILKLWYHLYLPLFAKKDSTVYVDPYGKWYALYYSDLKKWRFEKGDYLNQQDDE